MTIELITVQNFVLVCNITGSLVLVVYDEDYDAVLVVLISLAGDKTLRFIQMRLIVPLSFSSHTAAIGSIPAGGDVCTLRSHLIPHVVQLRLSAET